MGRKDLSLQIILNIVPEDQADSSGTMPENDIKTRKTDIVPEESYDFSGTMLIC